MVQILVFNRIKSLTIPNNFFKMSYLLHHDHYVVHFNGWHSAVVTVRTEIKIKNDYH